jgi:uncharacterized protein (TIRG00374 family)
MLLTQKTVSRLLLFLGLLILTYFLSTIDVNSLYLSIKSINIFYFLIAVLLTALNIVVKGYRWKLIVKHLTGMNISFSLANLSIMAGVAVGSLLPGRCDVAKPLMLKNLYDISLNRTLAGMFMERVLDILALFFLFCISAILVLKDYSSSISIVEFIVFFLILISIPVFLSENCIFVLECIVCKIPKNTSFKDKLIDSFSSFIRSFSILKDKKGIYFAFISLFAMFIETLRVYYVFKSLSIQLPIDLSIFSFSSSIIFGLMTMIPGGVGATEFSQTEILQQYIFVSSDFIKSAVLLDRFLSYYSLIFVGSIVLLTYHKIYRTKKG